MLKNKKILSVLIISIYLIFLIPYIIASNSGETGIVLEDQKIDYNSLPDDIQDLLIYKSESYNTILIEDQITKVKDLKDQVAKEKKLIISQETQKIGSFIGVDNIESDTYVPNNIITTINQSFDRLIIGNPKKVKFGEIIEVLNYYDIAPIILAFSKIDFLVGGMLVVLFLTYLRQGMIALWNIPAMITCYSFQFFLVNIISSMNKLQVESIPLFFGFLFIPLLLLAIKTMRFEETSEGKQRILELYKYNKKILNELIRTVKFWNK